MRFETPEVRDGVTKFPEDPGTSGPGPDDYVVPTRQSEAEDADINTIVRRFYKTGTLPDAVLQGVFADVSEVDVDYRVSLDRVNAVNDAFELLEASTRARFDNDPAVFMDRYLNPVYRKEFQDLGLIAKDAPAEPASGPAPTP